MSQNTPAETELSGILFVLNKIKIEAEKGDISLQQLVDLFGEKSHQILLFSISIPFIQPIPLLGLSTPLGVLMALLSFLHVAAIKPWLPKSFADKKISAAVVFKSAELAFQVWSKVGFLIRPRWLFFKRIKFFKWLSFIVVAINGILLALPLPIPFTNTIPNVAILLNSVGQLEDDGVLIFLSYLAFLASTIFFAGVLAGLGFGLQTLLAT